MINTSIANRNKLSRFLSQPEYQWQRRFAPIISYLEQSNSLEELYRLLRKKHDLSTGDVALLINSGRSVVESYEKNKRDLKFAEILTLSRYHEDFRLGAIAYLEQIK